MESGFTVMTPFPGTPMYWRALREGLLPKRMQFSKWNSYSSMVKTYCLSTTDLDMARWWARIETIVAYRKMRKARGLQPLLGLACSALRLADRVSRLCRHAQGTDGLGRKDVLVGVWCPTPGLSSRR